MENDVQIFFYAASVFFAIITIYVATELGCKKILIPIGLLIVLIFSLFITEQKFIPQSLLFSCFIVIFFIYPFTKIKLTEMVIPIITSIIAISIISNLIFYIFNIYLDTFNDKMFPVISELSQDDKPGVLAVLLNKIGLLDDSQEKFGALGDLRDKFGVLGDFFGGIFNPILTFASLILLLGTFFVNLKELKETREEMKKSHSVLQQQRFEDVFFKLLERCDSAKESFNKQIENIQYAIQTLDVIIDQKTSTTYAQGTMINDKHLIYKRALIYITNFTKKQNFQKETKDSYLTLIEDSITNILLLALLMDEKLTDELDPSIFNRIDFYIIEKDIKSKYSNETETETEKKEEIIKKIKDSIEKYPSAKNASYEKSFFNPKNQTTS